MRRFVYWTLPMAGLIDWVIDITGLYIGQSLPGVWMLFYVQATWPNADSARTSNRFTSGGRWYEAFLTSLKEASVLARIDPTAINSRWTHSRNTNKGQILTWKITNPRRCLQFQSSLLSNQKQLSRGVSKILICPSDFLTYPGIWKA